MRYSQINSRLSTGVIFLACCLICGGCERDCSNCPNNESPRAVALMEPANEAVLVETDVVLRWMASDPDGDSLTFDLYFGTSDDPALVSLGQSASSYELIGLQYSTHYFWRVVVWDDDSDSLASPLSEFELADAPNWQPLGGGTNQVVLTLAEFQGELIAGGFFREAEGLLVNRIAAWNGSVWHAMDNGVRRSEDYLFTFATDAAVYGDKLFVCGLFDSAGSVRAKGIATWDGSSWSDVGAMDAHITHIEVFGDRLFAAGSPQYSSVPMRGGFASWNAHRWETVGSGIPANGIIIAMVKYDGALVVAGAFGSIDQLSASSIAATDGDNWFSLGSGINGRVESLCAYKDKLIAGGNFSEAGGTVVSNIACWDGVEWTCLGEGMDGRVVALIEYRGSLIAGGFFTSAGGWPANHIAIWNGKRWRPMGEGADGAVWSFKILNDRLIVGGQFSHIGGIEANNIASWGN